MPRLKDQGFKSLAYGASYGNDRGPDDLQFVTVGVTLGFDEKQKDWLAHGANVGLSYNFVDDDEGTKTHFAALSGAVTLYEGKLRRWKPNLQLQTDLVYAKPESDSSDVAGVIAIELKF